MGRNFRALNVYKTVTQLLANPRKPGRYEVAPPWLKALEKIPPSEILTRPIPVQHHPPNKKLRKPRNTFKPQHIVYPEDQLRKAFYKDHPWELARPRTVLEIDGKDARFCDWSKGLIQPGIPLSGECVVQRQLWVMQNEGLTRQQAYDKVRREFYALRHEEEVERRIAREEAMMVGAYFGKSRLQIGMELEDAEYERWKKWAVAENAKQTARASTVFQTFGESTGELDGELVEDALPPAA